MIWQNIGEETQWIKHIQSSGVRYFWLWFFNNKGNIIRHNYFFYVHNSGIWFTFKRWVMSQVGEKCKLFDYIYFSLVCLFLNRRQHIKEKGDKKQLLSMNYTKCLIVTETMPLSASINYDSRWNTIMLMVV